MSINWKKRNELVTVDSATWTKVEKAYGYGRSRELSEGGKRAREAFRRSFVAALAADVALSVKPSTSTDSPETKILKVK